MLRLTLAAGHYDRTEALRDGRVRAEGIDLTYIMLRVEDRLQRTIPVPTVSQGIAVFPLEADEIYRLIDLADRRLYVAKARGRNQIEPPASYWEKTLSEQNSAD